jgi:Kef-type K+ transport system membrane component KefB
MVHHTPLSLLLILMVGLLIARLSAGTLARWAVPAILVELLVGFLLGNTVLPFQAVAPLSGLTELGVLSLFFQVGLEVRGDLLATQRRPLLRLVAISALAPLLFFWPLQRLFALSLPATVLCLAVLCATGTGVTLRVLAQRQALGTPSGRLLVGVSVLDDLPAITLLAIATALGARVSGGDGPLGLLGPPLGVLLGLASLAAVDLWARQRRERPSSPMAILMLMIVSAWLGGRPWASPACSGRSGVGCCWRGCRRWNRRCARCWCCSRRCSCPSISSVSACASKRPPCWRPRPGRWRPCSWPWPC